MMLKIQMQLPSLRLEMHQVKPLR